MKISIHGKLIMSMIVMTLFILPAFARAEKQKIKVTVENASVRLKPDMTSEVIGEPAIGTVFEIEKKEGQWYEVKYRSEMGVLITGYIHEMFVELVSLPPPPPPPPPPSPPAAKALMFDIKIGGLFSLIRAGYDYDYSFIIYDETSTISDSVENSNGIGFDLGLGVFVTKNIEITGSAAYFSKSLTGKFGWSLPNPLLYNDIAYDDIATSPSLKEMIFSFGINFHPVTNGMIRPYIGGGGSYINAKMDLIKDATFTEFFYPDDTHSIEINEVQFEETKINKLGFNLRAGLNFMISNNICVYAEGKYIMAKTEVPHPLTSQFDEGEILSIDLGGASGCFGIKFIF